MKNHIERMLGEHLDLTSKILRLRAFTARDEFEKLSVKDQGLMLEQQKHMEAYRDVLGKRINRSTRNETND